MRCCKKCFLRFYTQFFFLLLSFAGFSSKYIAKPKFQWLHFVNTFSVTIWAVSCCCFVWNMSFVVAMQTQVCTLSHCNFICNAIYFIEISIFFERKMKIIKCLICWATHKTHRHFRWFYRWWWWKIQTSFYANKSNDKSVAFNSISNVIFFLCQHRRICNLNAFMFFSTEIIWNCFCC